MVIRRTRPPLIERIRFQITTLILVAAIIPYGIRVYYDGGQTAVPLFQITTIGIIIAIVAGYLLSRNVNSYPGVEATASFLPSYAVSFGIILLAFLFLRLNYNRSLLLTGFVLTLAWSFFLALKQQANRPTIGVLPIGDAEHLLALRNVHWRRLESPSDTLEGVDAVAVDLRADLPSEWDSKLADIALQFIPVFHSKHLAESLTGRVELEHLSENNFGSLSPASAYMAVKHSIDWIAAAFMAILLMPVMLVVGIAVKTTSKGPALFRQQRIGYQGRPFTVLKFRTMRMADPTLNARDAAITKPSDSRITRLGAFLRVSRLDELPQIFNVLRGEMSWIGPRPEAEVLSKWYEAEIPFYRYRHIVRPGIAGWAQVNQGHVADVDNVKGKLHYDFYYIKNYSPWIDLLIVVLTIRTMITGFGAR